MTSRPEQDAASPSSIAAAIAGALGYLTRQAMAAGLTSVARSILAAEEAAQAAAYAGPGVANPHPKVAKARSRRLDDNSDPRE